ncbi:hypothetical protein ES288_A07G145000v1 [Gossypium darwinii]|uniref:Zinc knuckle CX2CX4HX4C domain-containing protein n=2 Tax=Gossypium TaxID=3633 RepID=A0A5D2FVE7_GOSDA|nr:hypothetical protein ES288_A07G145000v1 [Gossypium darwinii]
MDGDEYIGCRMARTNVVKLLGRRIGFNPLLNRVSLLRNLICLIQMMDLVRFQDENDFNRVLVGAIGQTIGPVVKLDVHTVSACRGRKPLVLKVKINGRMLHVEYESPQNVFFKCGRYGHGLNI